MAAGHAPIDAAKKDGRWTAAYDSQSNATFPEDFLAPTACKRQGTRKRSRGAWMCWVNREEGLSCAVIGELSFSNLLCCPPY